MDKRELIKRWRDELKMWLRIVNGDALSYTKEQKTKAANFAGCISSFLKDVEVLEEEVTGDHVEYMSITGMRRRLGEVAKELSDMQVVKEYNLCSKQVYVGVDKYGYLIK